jgi:hypothetical protein
LKARGFFSDPILQTNPSTQAGFSLDTAAAADVVKLQRFKLCTSNRSVTIVPTTARV